MDTNYNIPLNESCLNIAIQYLHSVTCTIMPDNCKQISWLCSKCKIKVNTGKKIE